MNEVEVLKKYLDKEGLELNETRIVNPAEVNGSVLQSSIVTQISIQTELLSSETMVCIRNPWSRVKLRNYRVCNNEIARSSANREGEIFPLSEAN